jgi:UDP-N-acetylglucosamine acyltransferase
MSDFYEGNENAWRFPGNQIHETAIIYDCVEMGIGNVIGAYTVIGSNGEIRNCKEFKGKVSIGNDNTISEHVTIQRPASANSATVIGSDNLIMAHSHIGHDVVVGNNCEICTGTILGGYANIGNNVKLKLGVTIRNRIAIGSGALVGLGSSVVKPVGDNAIVYGNPAKPKL